MKAMLNRLRLWAGVDRPVFFAGLGQAWSLFSGPITILLVTRFFTAKTQGYYYTFGSVVAFGVFLELGFSQCIVQFASHEFARLRFRSGGAIEGDPLVRSRLISLGRLSLKWYGVIAILAFIGLGLGGHWFFWAKHDPTVAWVWPWWSLCLVTGLSLLLLPVAALLEGCNQMAFVYGLRTLSRVVAAIGPCIVEVFMHPEQLFHPKLSLAVQQDGALVSPPWKTCPRCCRGSSVRK